MRNVPVVDGFPIRFVLAERRVGELSKSRNKLCSMDSFLRVRSPARSSRDSHVTRTVGFYFCACVCHMGLRISTYRYLCFRINASRFLVNISNVGIWDFNGFFSIVHYYSASHLLRGREAGHDPHTFLRPCGCSLTQHQPTLEPRYLIPPLIYRRFFFLIAVWFVL